MPHRVGQVVMGASNGRPLPVISWGEAAIVLLPLVDPTGSARIVAALRAQLPDLSVTPRSLTLAALAARGPLSGRLDEARVTGESQ